MTHKTLIIDHKIYKITQITPHINIGGIINIVPVRFDTDLDAYVITDIQSATDNAVISYDINKYVIVWLTSLIDITQHELIFDDVIDILDEH